MINRYIHKIYIKHNNLFQYNNHFRKKKLRKDVQFYLGFLSDSTKILESVMQMKFSSCSLLVYKFYKK